MNRLKLLREEKNMLQEDLAKILSVSQKTISNYEKGLRDMSTDTLSKLSEFFDVSIDYLLGKSNIRNSKQEDSINEELIKIGFSMKDYTPPTEKQKEQIKALLEVILKDNKKDEEKKDI
ncbi:MAG: helix-turn-helix transcriptional regulator [Clostridia bacterium]|nr:helix-turn-helix transcriptional regulator [Clostridia bacterium]